MTGLAVCMFLARLLSHLHKLLQVLYTLLNTALSTKYSGQLLILNSKIAFVAGNTNKCVHDILNTISITGSLQGNVY